MIVGLGNDLANIKRIEATLERFGERFVRRLLSEEELQEIRRREEISFREYACAVAKRFAAKEACSKALGTGIRQGTFWRDMQLLHQPGGKPELKLSGGALRHLQRLCPGKANLLLTLTDDYPWAQAVVIIESL